MARRSTRKKKTSGDVLRINVTPWKGKKSDSFPWVRVFRHPYGVKYAADQINTIEEDPGQDETKQEFARRLGMKIIRKSQILRKWFK
jgi:hypothetical protein